MSIKENLKALRKKAGLTQAELADKTGLSCSAIGSYEKGLREPNAKAMAALERFFNVSTVSLYGNRKVRVRKVCKKEAPEAPAHGMYESEDMRAYSEELISSAKKIFEDEFESALEDLLLMKNIDPTSYTKKDFYAFLMVQYGLRLPQMVERTLNKLWKL